MKPTLAALALLAVSGCTPTGTPTPAAQNVVSAICAQDPLLYASGQVAGTLVTVPSVSTALGVDAVLVHPLVVAECAKYGQVPAAVAAQPAVVVPAPPK